ncbi:hypothetical protein I350_01822 [Cryptococcus amylolentus CBS 6273]|uniref:Epoxide hydrolase N-terminal domain-containing protein n=1 Tax=Cryptococcus amylolentus CBS 6273 TaxID=1296118 RepID=A0A1E3KDN9_9TREE|nr:hypothetical protein I350_01822 [Cryptococcus amylolentus CBS 6273]
MAPLPHTPTIPIEPFTFHVPDTELRELQDAIKASRIAKQSYENVSADENDFGVTRKWLIDTKDEWMKFDWRKQEERINAFPAYKAKIKNKDGLNYSIHFTGLISEKKDAIPVILSHGWPGCFFEFIPLLELVSKRYAPSELPYHLVVPSLPGWLFSSPPPTDREFSVIDVGYLFHSLMVGLGFGGGYVAQGGDIGALVTNELGATYDACKRTGAPKLFQYPILLLLPSSPSPPPDVMIEIFQKYAYALEQASRPSTVGLVVGSNPISLLAWIGEKYLAWTDQSPSTETILTIISLYWFTDCFTTSLYTYRYGLGVRRNDPATKTSTEYQSCPTGFSNFPKEISPISIEAAKKRSNIIWSREHDSGGHFAALEKPAELWQDVEDYLGANWDKYTTK